jgi:hypothetical protein
LFVRVGRQHRQVELGWVWARVVCDAD